MTDDTLKAKLKASLEQEQFADLLDIPNADIPNIKYTIHVDTALTDDGWPDPSKFKYATIAGGRGYQSSYFEGTKVGVTSVLKVLGLGTEGLIKWSANEERKAVLEACEHVVSSGARMGPREFSAAVEAKLGSARQHQRILNKAADIGTAAHQAVRTWLEAAITQGSEPDTSGMPDEALVALMSFQDWWAQSGLKAVRCEQPVWHDDFAGTIDVVAEHPTDGLGVLDLKSGKAIYDEHHLQVSAYMKAGRNFADLKWAKIVRLPKYLTDPTFEVKELGDMYQRHLTLEQLWTAFDAALTCWKLLVAKESQ